MDDDIKEIIASEKDIEDICTKLGKQITKDYQGKQLAVIGILNGCNPFVSDLVKHIDLMITLDYMRVTSYHGTRKSGGEIELLADLEDSIQGKNILIVDDIIDTGRTLKFLDALLKEKGAKSIATCVMLDKKEARLVDYNATYVGEIIPNKFVVGYGLDYNYFYRNLPYIGVLKEEVYKKGDK